jgi:hypothetical protein
VLARNRLAAEVLGVDEAFVAWRARPADASKLLAKYAQILTVLRMAELYKVELRRRTGGSAVYIVRRTLRPSEEREKTMSETTAMPLPEKTYSCREPGCLVPPFLDGAKRLLHETDVHPDSPYRTLECTVETNGNVCGFRTYPDDASMNGHQRMHRGLTAEQKRNSVIVHPVVLDAPEEEPAAPPVIPEAPPAEPEAGTDLAVIVPDGALGGTVLAGVTIEDLATELGARLGSYHGEQDEIAKLTTENQTLRSENEAVKTENLSLQTAIEKLQTRHKARLRKYSDILEEAAREMIQEGYDPGSENG